MPHFDVTTIDGRHVRYADLWQRRNLVLIAIDPAQLQYANQYLSTLQARFDEFTSADTTLVATSDSLPGIQAPSVVVVDRWGEILHVARAERGDASTLPTVEDLLAWIHFARIQCPECPP
jgi:hypothetical protein